ncbi:hypothetical protein CCAX7_47470 [Capsulimonas corticalis]|uniref:Uncharacterized protein n=1 Tax=Capsulimonas corticalis TaxID=2219043 RepID=A0A402CQM7_9BACT|nr:type II toxin-antitoxin system ParD family antitoxin [Capsulimonas corticalis]BDI32696.1 hypothetical protein CCAX7_47470 [Capsulimonas corticalis]
MSISLTPEQEAIVQDRLASGRYASAEDVITDALFHLNQTDEEYIAWVRREVTAGAEELTAGASAPLEPLDVLLAEARARYHPKSH